MKNKGLFSSLFIDELKENVALDDAARGRMATLSQAWQNRNTQDTATLWESFLKQALGYLEFVPPNHPDTPGVYPLYENWNFNKCISILYLAPPGSDIDDTAVGRFYPAKLLAQLKKRKLNWGILTDGAHWRLYSTKSSRPYEDFVELPLAETLESTDEAEYGLFERFFHKDSFISHPTTTTPAVKRTESEDTEENEQSESHSIEKCPLDQDREQSEKVLEQRVKEPFLSQIDEVLQYICNGFIFDTQKSGEEYTEDERSDIFESAVKLIYRCLFLFYAEARRLLPTDQDKADLYRRHSIQALCLEAHRFRWGKRQDLDKYDLWKHLKGLISAVNDGDPEYGIMGYNGGLFDNEEERFLGKHQLRNDFLSRALYLLAFVEPYNNEPDGEYPIPYEDLEVRHLGELYENILEFTVQLADADRIRRRTKNGTEILLASQTTKKVGDTLIKKGEVYFGESALERKQTGSYYTAESLVRFLNEKTIVQPLREAFERKYRRRFNDFLEQAIKGHDVGTRRGAAQSAAALIERFAEEEVLKFKVCDLAMGSGHFLVDASNQMAGLVIALLEEVPYIEGLTVAFTSHPNYWRRRITRHCLYGVDLNPLAVNLAKLSLWLNCFASEHKLTFLDHHLRCGNSLIGIRSFNQLASIPERKNDRKNSGSQKLLFDYNDLSSVLASAAKNLTSITNIDEDDTDSQRAILDEARQATSDVSYLADLYTAYLMDSNITAGIYKELFERLAKGKSAIASLNSTLEETLECVGDYQNNHKFYHWPLEFPDVFAIDSAGGFSAIVGNPPWDMVTAQPAEFFGKYDPSFRSLKRSDSLKRIKELCRLHPEISNGWGDHQKMFREANSLFNESIMYENGPTGRNNLYHYFLLRSYDILRDQGHIGMVLPGSFNADIGASPLRKLFFLKCQIERFFCFSNEKFVFKNVHHAFRFIVFAAKKGGTTQSFKVCFLTDPREAVAPALLEGILFYLDEYGREITYQTVESLSPGKFSILEFRRQRDAILTEKLYSVAEHIGKKTPDINFRFSIEMMSNNDAWRFDDSRNSDVPVYVGRCFQQYDNNLATVASFIPESMLKDIYSNTTAKPWNEYRIVFRDVTGGTSERTCISCILPPPNACLETARILYPSSKDGGSNEELKAYTLATLNSFCLDYVMRFMVRLHLSQHIMERAPFVRCTSANITYKSLVARTLRLIATNKSFGKYWRTCFSNDWQSAAFWYPTSVSIDNYGPAHEQQIRCRLRDEAIDLTPDWGSHCGVHDRMPDRRDTGDRAQLRAEIDAHVAHLYGLSHNDFAYILDTFPVLKKKEQKAFGEFISKRKCLEEYDRLAQVLGVKK
jgi:hypothetical protein